MPAKILFSLLAKAVSFKDPWKLGQEVTVPQRRGSAAGIGVSVGGWTTLVGQEAHQWDTLLPVQEPPASFFPFFLNKSEEGNQDHPTGPALWGHPTAWPLLRVTCCSLQPSFVWGKLLLP